MDAPAGLFHAAVHPRDMGLPARRSHNILRLL